MPRELYNEGRVRGESCYEAYVKNALEEDPNTQPVSEREWLASTLAMGSSMLLKIDPFTPEKEDNIVKDYKLPDESSLIAPSTIIASFFAANPSDFSGIYDDTGWVTQVGSYGDLLENTSTQPKNGGTYSYTSNSMTEEEKTRLLNYMRIQDGLVLQDGTWETRTASNNPKRILKQPNFKNSPTVRIRFAHEVTTSFFVLLTGFVTFGVVIGESGFGGGAADTANPYNGDFLGPAVFPWANKIMFHTSSAMAYQSQTSIKAGDGTNVEIVTNPDSFDTYIKVKNLIESESEPYLTVWQDDPNGYAGWTKLTLNMEELKSWIASNLSGLIEAGTGITVTENKDKDGNVTSVTIGTAINPGAGIAIDKNDDNSITITNTEVGGVYSTARGWGVIDDNLYSKDNFYVIKWYNHFFCGTGGKGEYSTSAPEEYGTPYVQVCPTWADEDSNKMSSVSVILTTNSSDNLLTRWGPITDGGFIFRHSHTIYDTWPTTSGTTYDGRTSRLFAIMFPSGERWKDISFGDSKQFIETSDWLTGIWNIQGYWSGGGYSWPVKCYVDHEKRSDNNNTDFDVLKETEDYTIFTVSAMSISDGYNNQYCATPYTYYQENTGNPALAGLLNMTVSFTIVFNT